MKRVSIEKELKGIHINADFSFEQLRCVIFGPSGSGKSSILKMIAGFFPPDKGVIKIDSKIFFSSDKKINIPINKRNIGYLPQEYTLFPHLNVRDNILYGIKAKNMKLDESLFNLLIKAIDIKNYLETYPSQLSGGQQQRVALIRAIIVKPDILLLDEPFSALDKPIREELRDLVIYLSEKFSIPIIFVTHDIDEAFILANEVILLKNGKTIQSGKKTDVLNKPINTDAAKLLNFKNIWKIEKIKDGMIKVNGTWLETNNIHGTPSYCCIKPENVIILRDDTDISDKENKITGTIQSIHNRSNYSLISFEGKQFKIKIQISPHVLYKMNLKEGKIITVSLKKNSLILLEQ